MWFTGLSASGKTTICEGVAASLRGRDFLPVVLDGDVVRRTLSSGLGFSRSDREENIRRIAAAAFQAASHGNVVLVAAISPYRQMRETLKHASPVTFVEVFVDAPLSLCEQRDPRGLYRRARAGEIHHFTGIDDVYDPPDAPGVHCRTQFETIAESTAKVLAAVDLILTPCQLPPS